MTWFQRGAERAVLLMRWLVAPFFVGLFVGVLVLIGKFFLELYQLVVLLPDASGKAVIVGVLKLVDFALVANLVLIVIFAGHENFVGRVDPAERPEWPDGITRLDIGGLKEKLLGAIAAIATIETLEWYLDIEDYSDLSKFIWVIGFQLAFMASLLMLAVADRFTSQGKTKR
jgi:uncharacterized protein (TIGR00645 family)